MCTTGMYTLLSSMSVGYNDILNKKEKKKFDHHAFSVSSLPGCDGFHMECIIGLHLKAYW